MIPVLLSGGGGTRLWPLSRTHYPKQFLPLTGDKSMLQQTLLRLDGLADTRAPIVIANEDHRFLVAEQLQAIGAQDNNILLEPVGRNTAPAVTLAALCAQSQYDDDPLLLVLPADHAIADVPAFHQALATGRELAEAGKLVTFGITPNKPETGYGYIKRGSASGGGYLVDQFVEKPNAEVAQRYVNNGDYYWNAGIFLFKASSFMEELQRLAPEVFEASNSAFGGRQEDLDFIRIDAEAFARNPDIAIDYAIMEKTDRAAVVAMDPGWNDLGSWSAMWEQSAKDEHGNALSGDVIPIDSHQNLIYAEDTLVATIGVDNLAIVQTADAVLVADKDQVQNVKAVVQTLKQQGRREPELHTKVHRPWGNYETLNAGTRFQVKRIEVKPGASLSLQMHHHRAEHWIVVSGTARVTRDDDTFLVTENESTYIPLGAKHRLENCGAIPLQMIEVQSGSYLGEDDIVRFDDNYGRTEK